MPDTEYFTSQSLLATTEHNLVLFSKYPVQLLYIETIRGVGYRFREGE